MIENYKDFNIKKEEIEKIINIFNNNETILEFNRVGTRVKATIKNRKLVIDFGDSKSYKFKINDKYLETNIDKNSSSDKIIIMVLADSIAVKYGEVPKSVYPLFSDDTIFNYNLNNGINFTDLNDNYNVKISLNTYIKNRN